MTLESAQPVAELVIIQQVSVFLQIEDRTKLIPQSRLIRFSSVNSFEGLGLCRPAKLDYSLGYALLSNPIKCTICLLFQPLDLCICKLSSKNSNENTHSWNLNSHFSWLKLLLFTSEHLVNFYINFQANCRSQELSSPRSWTYFNRLNCASQFSLKSRLLKGFCATVACLNWELNFTFLGRNWNKKVN